MTPDQCRAARALRGISQDALSEMSGVSKRSIASFELGQTAPHPKTIDSIKKALECGGIEFIPENGGGSGVRFKKDFQK